MAKRSREFVDHIAERFVIGNLLLDQTLLPLVATNLRANALASREAAMVYDAVQAVASQYDGTIDFVALEKELARRDPRLLGYVTDLQSEVMPMSPNLMLENIQRINNQKRLRDLFVVAEDLQRRINPDASFPEVFSQALLQLQGIESDSTTMGRVDSMDDAVNEAVHMLSEWREGKSTYGLRTGFRSLDKVIGYLPSGELTLIAARTSMGKSAFAFHIAYNVARQIANGDVPPGQVLIFSAEMMSRDVVLRQACAATRTSLYKARSGQLTEEEYERVTQAMEEIRLLPVVIDPADRPTTTDIFFKASLLSTSSKVRLIVFDYIELSGDRHDVEELRISNVVRSLKSIAKRLDIPVIAISQLNRQVEQRRDRIPQLSDLRYSGGCEAEAYLVLLLHRPEYYVERGLKTENDSVENLCNVIVAKNRNGPVGFVPLYFHKESTFMADAEISRHAIGGGEYARATDV